MFGKLAGLTSGALNLAAELKGKAESAGEYAKVVVEKVKVQVNNYILQMNETLELLGVDVSVLPGQIEVKTD